MCLKKLTHLPSVYSKMSCLSKELFHTHPQIAIIALFVRKEEKGNKIALQFY